MIEVSFQSPDPVNECRSHKHTICPYVCIILTIFNLFLINWMWRWKRAFSDPLIAQDCHIYLVVLLLYYHKSFMPRSTFSIFLLVVIKCFLTPFIFFSFEFFVAFFTVSPSGPLRTKSSLLHALTTSFCFLMETGLHRSSFLLSLLWVSSICEYICPSTREWEGYIWKRAYLSFEINFDLQNGKFSWKETLWLSSLHLMCSSNITGHQDNGNLKGVVGSKYWQEF